MVKFFINGLTALLVATAVSVVPASGASPSAQWPQFRGPTGNGVATLPHPSQWSSEENLAWSAEVAGGGWSSPVVAGDRVFVTTAVSSDYDGPKGFGAGVSSMRSFFSAKPPEKPYSFEVHCLQLSDGKHLWTGKVASKKPPFKIHPSNSYATESPATDGQHVYAYFAAIGTVACLDLDGNAVWTRELGAYPTGNNFGTGSSLAILDGRVFIQCDNERESFLCALDTKTGEDTWTVKRSGKTSWSSPVVWVNRNRSELIACGSGSVVSYNPTSGATNWTLSTAGGAFHASPTFDADRIYFGQSGRNSRGPLIAVNAGAEGELTFDSIGEKGVAWTEKSSAPGMCSPVVASGKLFVLSRGILSCHDAKSGKRLYRERVPNASSVTASLWVAGNHLYALNESGETAVIEIADEFKLVSSNEVPGLYWSTPSIVGEALLIRDAKRLHCIRE